MKVNSGGIGGVYKPNNSLATAKKNKKEGLQFLSSNKMRTDVKITPSGLQYKMIEEGSAGAKPKAGDSVKVHYKGSYINGKIFDSSYQRKAPSTLQLSSVIKGWQEGIPKMNVGSKYQFYIPSDLAYGEDGSGKIGPNQALIFEVELLGINPKS